MQFKIITFAAVAAFSTAAISGPVVCVTDEGCPTAIYQAKADAPVIDWPEFVIEVEMPIPQPVAIAHHLDEDTGLGCTHPCLIVADTGVELTIGIKITFA